MHTGLLTRKTCVFIRGRTGVCFKKPLLKFTVLKNPASFAATARTKCWALRSTRFLTLISCSPDITYSFYPVWAALFDITYTTLPLSDDFTIPVDQLAAKGIVIANPNAPTGIALGLDGIEQILIQNKNSVVIVDEAYAAFGAQSTACLVPKYPNLLVVHTLSKSHFACGGCGSDMRLVRPHLIGRSGSNQRQF